MRALAVAIGASLVINAIAVVWLRPSVATAAAFVGTDDDADRDSDVSRDDTDPPSEVVVELMEESAVPGGGAAVAATKAPRARTAVAPNMIVHAQDANASNMMANTQDSAVRASDSAVGASEVSGGSTGAAPTQVFVRTLDAILAPADASTSGAVSDAGPHTKMMGMRGVDLALTTQAVDAILSRPRAPDASATASKESPDPPDEAAQLRHDIVELDKRMMGPDLEKYATADEIDGMREELDAKKRDLEQMTIHPTGGGHYGARHETYIASIEQDGTTHLEDRPNFQWHGFSGTFDVTDWVTRSIGDDPYARAKMRFLDRTRPERIAIGNRYRAEQLAHAPQLMQANIERAWATIQDPEARKEALFDLWDDCAETGEPAVVEAGAAARMLVLGVIHARVTYSAADLERLNARRHSTARFEP